MNRVSCDICVYHLWFVCVFSLGGSSAPEWLEPVLWPRTWFCELMWEQQQHFDPSFGTIRTMLMLRWYCYVVFMGLFLQWFGVTRASNPSVSCGHKLPWYSFIGDINPQWNYNLRCAKRSPRAILSVRYRVTRASTLWYATVVVVLPPNVAEFPSNELLPAM